MTQGLVSIVMPAYNAAAYINDAIASVLSQSYQLWELLVIDDGSTDNTAMLIKRAQNKDQRIIYYHQLNKGLGGARNAAFSMAKGEWIAFLDSDDIWHPDKLMIQMEYAAKHRHIDLFFSQGEYLHQQETALSGYDSLIGEYSAKIMYQQLMEHNAIPVLSVCLKTELLNKAGTHDSGFLIGGCEDWDQWLRCSLSGAAFYGIADRLFKYRVHEGGMSANTRRMNIAGAYVIVKNWKAAWLTEKEMTSLRAKLINIVPLVTKALLTSKNIKLMGSYGKLLVSILSLSGHLLPQLIFRKLHHRLHAN